jgi:hypothetical protein
MLTDIPLPVRIEVRFVLFRASDVLFAEDALARSHAFIE